jgi:hypothetical protein
MLHRASDLGTFFGATAATENVHEIWNVRFIENSMKKIIECKLHLVEVQEVRWDKGGTDPADTLYILVWK